MKTTLSFIMMDKLCVSYKHNTLFPTGILGIYYSIKFKYFISL